MFSTERVFGVEYGLKLCLLYYDNQNPLSSSLGAQSPNRMELLTPDKVSEHQDKLTFAVGKNRKGKPRRYLWSQCDSMKIDTQLHNNHRIHQKEKSYRWDNNSQHQTQSCLLSDIILQKGHNSKLQ